MIFSVSAPHQAADLGTVGGGAHCNLQLEKGQGGASGGALPSGLFLPWKLLLQPWVLIREWWVAGARPAVLRGLGVEHGDREATASVQGVW